MKSNSGGVLNTVSGTTPELFFAYQRAFFKRSLIMESPRKKAPVTAT